MIHLENVTQQNTSVCVNTRYVSSVNTNRLTTITAFFFFKNKILFVSATCSTQGYG